LGHLHLKGWDIDPKKSANKLIEKDMDSILVPFRLINTLTGSKWEIQCLDFIRMEGTPSVGFIVHPFEDDERILPKEIWGDYFMGFYRLAGSTDG